MMYTNINVQPFYKITVNFSRHSVIKYVILYIDLFFCILYILGLWENMYLLEKKRFIIMA